MVCTRLVVNAVGQEVTSRRGQLYRCSSLRGRQVNVAIVGTKAPTRVVAESTLADPALQPFIHDFSVVVVDKKQSTRFMIFFKNHTYLPINKSLPQLHRGDLLVMRMCENGLPVHLRAGDRSLTDFVVKSFLDKVALRNRTRRRKHPLRLVRPQPTRRSSRLAHISRSPRSSHLA